MYFWFLLATVLKRAFLLSLIFQFYIAGLEMLRCFSIRVKLEKKKIILIFFFFNRRGFRATETLDELWVTQAVSVAGGL